MARGGAAPKEPRWIDVEFVVDGGVNGKREKVGAQEAVVVDSCAPGRADAAGDGQAARREAPEYVQQGRLWTSARGATARGPD